MENTGKPRIISATIKSGFGDERDTVNTHQRQANAAFEVRDFAAAEDLYRKALALATQLGYDNGVAAACHQLGRVAHEKREIDAAAQWYISALEAAETAGDDRLRAITYHEIARLAAARGNPTGAGSFLIDAIKIFNKADPDGAAPSIEAFIHVHNQVSASEKTQLEALWRAANLGLFPPPARRKPSSWYRSGA